MTVHYISDNSVFVTATGSLTLTKPASVVVGDILLVSVFPQDTQDCGGVTPPSGWSAVPPTTTTIGGGTVIGTYGFWKVATGSEPSTYTFAFTNAITSGGGAVGQIANYGTPGTVIGTYAHGQDQTADMVWPSTPVVSGGRAVALTLTLSGGGTSEWDSGLPDDAVGSAIAGLFYSSGTFSAPSTAAHTNTSANGTTTTAQQFVGFLIATPSAPAAPTNIAPSSGALVDATAIIPFQLGYNSTDAASQNGYTLGIKLGATTHYWNASAGTLTTTSPVWNTLATPIPVGGTLTVMLPANTLTNGQAYSYTSASQESSANLQGAASALTSFSTQAAPTATITAPTNGSTITTTSTPTVTWTETLHSGSVQTAWQVIVESGAYSTQPGSGTQVANTGLVPTAALTSGALPPLPNLGTYRIFLQITQTGNQPSLWVFVTVTISVTPPNTPTLTATAGTDSTTGCPRVVLTATGSDTGPKWYYTNTVFEFDVSTDGGTTWATVYNAGAVAPNSSDVALAYDYGLARGAVGTYRVRVIGDPNVTNIVGAYSTSQNVQVFSDLWWVLDITNPASALGIPVSLNDDEVDGITQDVTYALGARIATVEQDVWQEKSGGTTWICASKAQRDALLKLLKLGKVLLELDPNELADPGAANYFAVTKEIDIHRTGQQLIPYRTVQITWVTQLSPI